jgi:hypothetical protein
MFNATILPSFFEELLLFYQLSIQSIFRVDQKWIFKVTKDFAEDSRPYFPLFHLAFPKIFGKEQLPFYSYPTRNLQSLVAFC